MQDLRVDHFGFVDSHFLCRSSHASFGDFQQVDNCLILNTLKVKGKEEHHGQVLHFDGGLGTRAHYFGPIGEGTKLTHPARY